MVKKKEKVADEATQQAERAAAQRLAAIQEFNRQNAGEAWIDAERIPTEEEVNAAKDEYEKRTVALRDKKDYLVADEANAIRVAKFLKKFIENGFWTQRYFVGVINFSEYITKFLEDAVKLEQEGEKVPLLTMEYGPLQFCYLMLENYAGHGLEDAKKMAEMWDEYVPIYDTIREHIEWYNNEVKMCEALKQRWGMLAQGYYLVLLTDNNACQCTGDEACPSNECCCEKVEEPCDECCSCEDDCDEACDCCSCEEGYGEPVK